MSESNRPSATSGYEQLLLGALRRALAPLVAFLLHRGITFPVLSSLIRGLYVEQAQKEFQSGVKPLTDSRLSLLTGIARRYVKEIRQKEAQIHSGLQAKASLGGKLIAEWLTATDYLDASGQPLPIPRIAAIGQDTPSFEHLAQRVNSDAWPASVLEKLIEMKLVSIDQHDHVHLLADAYLPSNDSRESLEYFAEHLHDHIATLSHNILGAPAPMIERSAYITDLSRESVEQVHQFSEEKTAELLREVYALASERYYADQDKPDNTHRLRLGIYFYTEDTPDTDANRKQYNE